MLTLLSILKIIPGFYAIAQKLGRTPSIQFHTGYLKHPARINATDSSHCFTVSLAGFKWQTPARVKCYATILNFKNCRHKLRWADSEEYVSMQPGGESVSCQFIHTIRNTPGCRFAFDNDQLDTLKGTFRTDLRVRIDVEVDGISTTLKCYEIQPRQNGVYVTELSGYPYLDE